MKKTLFCFGFLALVCPNSFASEATACGGDIDAEIEAILDSGIIELEAPVPVQNNCFPTCSIVALITGSLVNGLTILKEDIYKKTVGPVTRRSLLDEPSLMTDYFTPACGWGLNTDFFSTILLKCTLQRIAPLLIAI